MFKRLFGSSTAEGDDIIIADNSTHRYNRKVKKILILGDPSVGKSSIIKFAMKESGFEYSIPKSELEIKDGQNCFVRDTSTGKEVSIKLVDVPNTNDIGLILECIKGCDGFILVIDVTNESSFQSLNRYKSILMDNLSGMISIPCIIVANKIDLKNRRSITIEQVQNKANKFFLTKSAEYCECSALSGDGVLHIFESIYSLIRQSQQEDKPIIKASKKKGMLNSTSESTESIDDY
ncbi:hypothetical protein ABK040_002303 [Willaertia magna]